jgi:hypothetical protein
MLIGITGRIGAGKDEIGKIIKYLTYLKDNKKISYENWLMGTHWENRDAIVVKKFADKLKRMVCELLSCTMADLEDQDFKKTPLGDDWDNTVYQVIAESMHTSDETILSIHFSPYEAEIDRAHFSEYYTGGRSIIVRTKTTVMTPRLILQLLGTEFGRNLITKNIWINSLFRSYNEEEDNWVITDVRFDNEAEAITSRGGFIIQVIRDQESVDETILHASERSISNGYVEHVINNNGTIEDLINQVSYILKTHGQL